MMWNAIKFEIFSTFRLAIENCVNSVFFLSDLCLLSGGYSLQLYKGNPSVLVLTTCWRTFIQSHSNSRGIIKGKAAKHLPYTNFENS